MAINVNMDDLQSALVAARKWRNELRYAETLADATEKAIAAVGMLKELDAAVATATKAKEAAQKKQEEAEAGYSKVVADRARVEAEMRAITDKAKADAAAFMAASVTEINAKQAAADKEWEGKLADLQGQKAKAEEEINTLRAQISQMTAQRDQVKVEIDGMLRRLAG